MTGHKLIGKEALEWGFATHYMTSEKLPGLYQDLASKVTKDTTIEEVKAILDSWADSSTISDKSTLPHYDEILTLFSPDSISSIMNRITDSTTDFAL